MMRIHLSKKVWHFDELRPLGPAGGFGEVFLGTSKDGRKVAVKRLHITKGKYISRELKIADFLLGHNHPHVIPIIDVGLDKASRRNFIVMALADQSLQDLIRESAPIAEHEVLEIVDAIVTGLDEIGRLVHRDLKPGNILLHNGVWKISDLGLARFVEASTSRNTMKEFLSPPYAAPEQWRGERATKTTDVYSLGCIIYALSTGRPPFDGPNAADYRQQHQFAAPPALSASGRLRHIASACLAKNQEVRPSVESLKKQIQSARKATGSSVRKRLGDAAAIVAEQQAAEEAQEALQKKVEADRKAAAEEAVSKVRQILSGLVDIVIAEAPNAKRLPPSEASFLGSKSLELAVRLGSANLVCDIPFPFLWPAKFDGQWDVLAGALIEISNERYGKAARPSRSANLWFGKITSDEGYRWWEVAYMFRPRRGFPRNVSWDKSHDKWAPFALGPWLFGTRDSPSLYNLREGDLQLATNPRPIDGEYLEDFYNRWTDWLAKAALTQIKKPRKLPKDTIDRKFLRK